MTAWYRPDALLKFFFRSLSLLLRINRWTKRCEVAEDDLAIIRNAQPSDIVIIVNSSTGAGSSSYINLLGNHNLPTETPDMTSCTKRIQAVVLDQMTIDSRYPPLAGRRVIVVDTPAFDGTSFDRIFPNPMGVLKRLGGWLGLWYIKGVKCGGAIYLHGITDAARMTDDAITSVNVFKKMCSTAALGNVVLCTTKWDILTEGSRGWKEAVIRKDGLHAAHWSEMLADGAHSFEIATHTPESAWAVIDKLLEGNHATVPFAIQTEFVDENRRMCDTEAGKVLNRQDPVPSAPNDLPDPRR